MSNSADWNCTYAYYHDGQRVIEIRNGSDQAIKQQVWGMQYVDELLQVGLNPSPSSGNTCSTMYWAMQDANWNVLGVVDSSGLLAERYEYTPYGQRTVFFGPGSNDPGCYAATIGSRRFRIGSVDQPYGICEVGHQGLMHDEESALCYNRARALHGTLGAFSQQDPLGFIDGSNLYEYVGSDPLSATDPSGRKCCGDEAKPKAKTTATGQGNRKDSSVHPIQISSTLYDIRVSDIGYVEEVSWVLKRGLTSGQIVQHVYTHQWIWDELGQIFKDETNEFWEAWEVDDRGELFYFDEDPLKSPPVGPGRIYYKNDPVHDIHNATFLPRTYGHVYVETFVKFVPDRFYIRGRGAKTSGLLQSTKRRPEDWVDDGAMTWLDYQYCALGNDRSKWWHAVQTGFPSKENDSNKRKPIWP